MMARKDGQEIYFLEGTILSSGRVRSKLIIMPKILNKIFNKILSKAIYINLLICPVGVTLPNGAGGSPAAQPRSSTLPLLQIEDLLLVASTPWRDPNSPIGEVMDGDQKIYDILEVSETLGKGFLGSVTKIVVGTPDGKIETLAAKLLSRGSISRQEMLKKRLEKSAELLVPLFSSNSGKFSGLNFERPGLTIRQPKNVSQGVGQNVGQDESQKSNDIVLSAVADGSVDKISDALKLTGNKDEFSNQLGLLLKLAKDAESGIQSLAAHGLVHNDIKASNILYSIEPSFDWKKPDPALIHFKLADYDAISKTGDLRFGGTRIYMPAEVLSLGKKPSYSTEMTDIYSLAASIYQVAFGMEPFFDYLSSGESRPMSFSLHMPYESSRLMEMEPSLRTQTYSNPKEYAFFMKWIDKQFQKLARQKMPDEARAQLDEIRGIVLNGMSFDPATRSLNPRGPLWTPIPTNTNPFSQFCKILFRF